MAWIDDIRKCVDALPAEFHLSDLDPFIPALHRLHPDNNHIREKIRQIVQLMRDGGELEALEGGRYRRTSGDTRIPLTIGQTTTRAELAIILGQKGQQALGRGMFKAAQGPYSRDILLFHNAESNPYGDRVQPGEELVYVGQGQEGDQKLSGFNRHLATHLEDGNRVHLFTKEEGSGSELRYVGPVVVEKVERVYRDDQRRSVLEFTLTPASEPLVASEFGRAYEDILEERLEPHTVARENRVHTIRRRLRDRAFAKLLRNLYGDECAVCGPPLVRDDWFDLQGAHVRSVRAQGPDARNNGILLCARHHWAFDSGVFSLDDRHRILMPERYTDPHGELVAGETIALPEATDLAPHPEYLGWHRRNWSFATG